jgi:O-antigen/teichoic acid export membrane protein
MNTVQRIAKNAAVLLSTQLISYLIAFFYAIYAARYLGPASYGVISFAVAFTSLFSFITDLGLSTLTVRDVARDKSLAPRYLINTVTMKIILSIIFFGLMAIAVNALGYPQETINVVYLFALFAILQSCIQIFYAMFQSYERMEYQALAQILNSVLILVGVTLAIKYGLGVIGFAWLYCASAVVVLGYCLFVFIWKFAKPLSEWMPWKVAIKWDFWKRTLRSALPFMLSMAIAGIFLKIDIIMISAMKGDTAAGYYNAACNLIIVLLTLAAVVTSAAFPAMSRFFVSSKDSLNIAMEKSSKYLFIMGLPMATGTFLLADSIIFAIYGAGFDQAAVALRLLILYLPWRFVCNATGWTLASINREPLRTLSVGIAILVNVALNFVLIPRYGIQGAGVATVISQVLMFLLFQYFVAKKFHSLVLHKIVIKPFVACVIMGILVFFIRQESLLLVIPAAAILYFILLVILKTFDAKDKKIFKDVIKGFTNLLPTRKIQQ